MHTNQYKCKTDQEEPQYNIGGNIHIHKTDHEKHQHNICGNIHTSHYNMCRNKQMSQYKSILSEIDPFNLEINKTKKLEFRKIRSETKIENIVKAEVLSNFF